MKKSTVTVSSRLINSPWLYKMSIYIPEPPMMSMSRLILLSDYLERNEWDNVIEAHMQREISHVMRWHGAPETIFDAMQQGSFLTTSPRHDRALTSLFYLYFPSMKDYASMTEEE